MLAGSTVVCDPSITSSRLALEGLESAASFDYAFSADGTDKTFHGEMPGLSFRVNIEKVDSASEEWS